MLKRLLSVILTLLMICPLVACNMFEHNYEKDYKQVIAVIKKFDEKSGFSYPGKNIYKYELINTLNANISSIQQAGGLTAEMTDTLLKQLVTRELVLIDFDRQLAVGEMKWRDTDEDRTDSNKVLELAYNMIDSKIKEFKTATLKEKGYDTSEFNDTVASTEPISTTYPIKEEEKDDEEELPQTEVYTLDKAHWPGFYGDEDDKSLGREAMRRFLADLKNNREEDYRVTKEDKKKFKDDDALVEKIINEQGIEYVYPRLNELYYIQMTYMKSAVEQVKIDKIKNKIEKVTVSDTEVEDEYKALYSSQETAYKPIISQQTGNVDISAYNKAMDDGTVNVLYHPSSNYFYVKHILLPFSDAQRNQVTQYGKSAAKPTAIDIKNYRNELVKEIVVYPHKNGENDYSKPTTVDKVFSEVKSAMASAEKSGNVKDAERIFDDLIYKYNTDSGIFNNPKGYAEVVNLDGAQEKYMPEFATAARDLYNNYKVGQVLPTYAVTEYGVHIMYFASKTTGSIANPKKVEIMDYQTPGEYKTIFEILKYELTTTKTDTAYTNWENKTVSVYLNEKKVYEKFEKRYKDLYGE